MSNITELITKYEKQAGLPPGLMASVFKQETGGKNAYVDDPSKYHYPLNAEGKRIAKHTGKESNAFGPYGILDSTGAKPGYGVAPLKNKTLEEQTRFAAEYMAGRIKSAGSIAGGLAGYGEGPKYANQVLARMGKGAPTNVAVSSTPSAGTAPKGGQVTQVAKQQAVEQEGEQPKDILSTNGILPGLESWLANNDAAPTTETVNQQVAAVPQVQDYWGDYLAGLQNQLAQAPQQSIFDMPMQPNYYAALEQMGAGGEPNFSPFINGIPAFGSFNGFGNG